jgi:hypothetical protein
MRTLKMRIAVLLAATALTGTAFAGPRVVVRPVVRPAPVVVRKVPPKPVVLAPKRIVVVKPVKPFAETLPDDVVVRPVVRPVVVRPVVRRPVVRIVRRRP